MTSVIPQSSVEAMSNSTTFSYAQAAKRHTPLESTSASTSAPGSITSQSKDDAVSTSTTSATVLTAQSTTSELSESVKSLSTDPEVTMPKQDSETTSVGESVSSATPTPALSVNASRDSDTAASESQAVNGDKHTRASSQAHRSTDGNDSRKGRKGKKGRAPEKDAENDQAQEKEEPKEPVKVILSEAPIPTVNFWEQRAASLKGKPTSSSSPVTGPVVESLVTPSASQENKVFDAKKKEDTESQNSTRPQRRSGDGPRPANDQLARRNGSRGSRLYEKDSNQTKENLPPVADASFWPTPDTAAVEDEKRKTQGKTERPEKEVLEEPTPAKPGKKKEWVAVPFVPSVTFNTQIQQRPSRPRGGGRVGRDTGRTGHSATPSTAGEKSPTAAGSAAAKSAGDRDSSVAPSRANSLPAQSTKRPSVDTSVAQSQRKPSAPTTGDRATGFHADASASGAKDKRHSYSQGLDHHGSQRHDQSFSKEGGFKDPSQTTRPGRGGRGGYRSDRSAQHNGNQAHMQQAYAPNGQRYQGSVSPPVNQNVFAPPFVPKGAGRDPRQRHSLPALNGHFPRVASNGAGKLHPIQTTTVDYSYPVHPYSAYPYAPYYNPQLVHVLVIQAEYYLSVENLCKDMFLRKQMDSQGFVPFDLIAGFKRMMELTEDVNMIRFACEESEKLDYVTGDDTIERLRLRDGWQSFVLPLAERDPHARVPGPNTFWYRSKHSRLPYQAPMVAPGYPTTSPTMYPSNFPPHEMDHMYHAYPNGADFQPTMNGGEVNGGAYQGDTPLSAAVPEFAPSVTNGGPLRLEDATTFTDKEVSNLVMVFENGHGQGEPVASSVDGPAETSSTEPAGMNGIPNGTEDAGSHEGSSVTDGALSSPPASSLGRVMSKSDGTQALVSDTNLEGKYPAIRARVLELRLQASPGEIPKGMKRLYDFWSHFLLEQFNPGMYEDFRNLALEDASSSTPSTYGLTKLLKYYEEVIANGKGRIWGSKHVYPEVFDSHFEDARARASMSSATNGDLHQ